MSRLLVFACNLVEQLCLFTKDGKKGKAPDLASVLTHGVWLCVDSALSVDDSIFYMCLVFRMMAVSARFESAYIVVNFLFVSPNDSAHHFLCAGR